MKKLIALALVLGTGSAFADNHKHLVSVGTKGVGLDWTMQADDYKKSSGTKKEDSNDLNLSANYRYVMPNNVMFGAGLEYTNDSSKEKLVGGGSNKSSSTTQLINLNAGYNFGSDLSNAAFGLVRYTMGNINSKDKDAGQPSEKSKSRVSGFGLEVGKRFSLASWGLTNLTYAPSISYDMWSWGGDAKKDGGLKTTTVTALNIVKFDVLF